MAASFLLQHCNSHLQAMLAAHPQHVDANPTAAKVKIEAEHVQAAVCNAPLVEAATGQAVMEAALALMWAVLSGPGETGETCCKGSCCVLHHKLQLESASACCTFLRVTACQSI